MMGFSIKLSIFAFCLLVVGAWANIGMANPNWTELSETHKKKLDLDSVKVFHNGTSLAVILREKKSKKYRVYSCTTDNQNCYEIPYHPGRNSYPLDEPDFFQIQDLGIFPKQYSAIMTGGDTGVGKGPKRLAISCGAKREVTYSPYNKKNTERFRSIISKKKFVPFTKETYSKLGKIYAIVRGGGGVAVLVEPLSSKNFDDRDKRLRVFYSNSSGEFIESKNFKLRASKKTSQKWDIIKTDGFELNWSKKFIFNKKDPGQSAPMQILSIRDIEYVARGGQGLRLVPPVTQSQAKDMIRNLQKLSRKTNLASSRYQTPCSRYWERRFHDANSTYIDTIGVK